MRPVRIQFAAHASEVRTHFEEEGGNFLEFNVEEDDPQLIADFLSPDFKVDPRHWAHWNATEFDDLEDDVQQGHG